MAALTQWGLVGTWIYFILVIVDNITGKKCEAACRVYNYTALVLETLIFIFFWTVLLPFVIKKWDKLSNGNVQWGMVSWHIMPFATLVVDTLWNKH